MKLIVCMDDKNGMAFNHRRQSRDRVLAERIMELTENAKLYIAPYSQTLFQADRVVVSPDYLTCAGQNDFCRTDPLPEYLVFHRKKFPLPLLRTGRLTQG